MVVDLIVEYVPGNSFLHKLDPRTKLVFFIFWSGISIIFDDPILSLLACIFVILLTKASMVPVRSMTKLVFYLSPMFILFMIVNLQMSPVTLEAIKDPSNIMFYLIPPLKLIPITWPGLFYSIAVCIRYVSIFYCLQLVLYTTHATDTVLALTRWKAPPSLALASSIGLGFIPVFKNTIIDVMNAQKCRGWRGVSAGNLVQKIRALPVLIIPVFLDAVKRAQRISVSIEARGYGYNLSARTYRRTMVLRKNDYIAFILQAVIGTIVYIVWIHGYLAPSYWTWPIVRYLVNLI